MSVNETEKYGVEEENEPAKSYGAATSTCPRCGGLLRSREITGIFLCQQCGSKPFEVEDSPNKITPEKDNGSSKYR